MGKRATVVLVFSVLCTCVWGETFVALESRLVGNESTMQLIEEAAIRNLEKIEGVTVLEDTAQATIIIRFNVLEVEMESGATYGSVVHLAVLVPFQSSNAGRQLLYIADDIGRAPPAGYESLIGGMIEDFGKLLAESRK